MNDQNQFTLAFSALGGASWLGGLNYLKNIIVALNSLEKPERPRLVIITPSSAEEDTFHSLYSLVDEVIPYPTHKGPIPARLLNKARKNKQDVIMGPLLRKHGIDCLFSTGDYGHNFPVSLLSWIPDFQHMRLPEMFSERENAQRNRSFMITAQLATRIVVTSEDVKNDFQRFAPAYADKVRVISGVSQVPAEIYDRNPEWVCREYNLPEKFFYAPNQFWKHKNHEVVLDALAILQATHPEITVVCTGNTYDERHPLHFAHLLTRVAQKGLRNSFILLGMIPQPHTLQLIRQSLAVLQPSHFEGWSNAVAEAKSVGKAILLSDLPVHREHNPPGGVFFAPNDPAELAKAMQTMFDNGASGPDCEMEEAARRTLHSRTQQFGRDFAAIAREAIA